MQGNGQTSLSVLLRHTWSWKVQEISAEVGFCGIVFRGEDPITSTSVGRVYDSDNRGEPHKVLLEVVYNRAQPKDEDTGEAS